jgi:hypothetical protein
MSPLSTDARELLDAARTAYDPRHDDRVRVRTALAATLPAAGAAAAGATAGGALKLVVFGVSVAVGSLGVLGGAGVVRTQHAPAPAAPKVIAMAPMAMPVAAAPEPTVVEQAAAPTVLEAAPAVAAPARAHKAHAAAPAPVEAETPKVPAPTPTPGPAHAAIVPSPCAPDAELAVVQRAQRWLAGSPGEALRQLDNFAGNCPDGVLVEERLATRAIALCLSERGDDGRAELAKLEARNPSSPALTRVREACGR